MFQKFIRWTFVVAIILIFLLWGATFVLENLREEDAQEELTDQNPTEVISPEAQYPEVANFLNNYFDQIKRGNFEVLEQKYWSAGVTGEISKSCGNPLEGQRGDAKEKWASCGYLRGVQVEIVDVLESPNGYNAVVRLTGPDGEDIGGELYPKNKDGHEMRVVETEAGLRTPNWNFLRNYD